MLCVLQPSRDLSLDTDELGRALALAHRRAHDSSFPPATTWPWQESRASRRRSSPAAPFPFRRTVTLDGVTVSVRMESWLAADTIRRMGFGHVIAAHQHTLIVERGVSFAAFDERRPAPADGLRVEHLRPAAALPHRYSLTIG